MKDEGKMKNNPLYFTDIYAITDSNLSLGRPMTEVVAALLASGVKIIQYREKRKNAGEMLEECKILRKMTREAGALFIINDYVDIAMLVEADGIHIGQDDLPAAEIRRLVGEKYIIGLSTHNPQQASKAVNDGIADYIGVGPIFPTRTKSDVCEAVGLEYLDYVVNSCSIPFVAIGGIKRNNLSSIVAHGAKCCCLVSELMGAPDIPVCVAEIRKIMKDAKI